MEISGFKRRLLLPGVVLTAAEIVVIILPLLSFYRPTPEQRTILVRAALPVLAGFVAVWGLAIASWFAPVQKAVSLRKRREPLLAPVTDAAYRAMLIIPNRVLLLRTMLWTLSLSVLAGLLYGLTAFPLQSVGTVIGVALMNSLVVSLFRSVWTAHVLASLRPSLFPGLEPLRYFADTYFDRLIKISLVLGAIGLAAIAGFIYFFIPITFEQFLLLQTYFPLALGLMTLAWQLLARRFRRPIEAYLDAAVYGEPRDRPGTTDPRAAAAFRGAQSIAYKLALSKISFWMVAAGAVCIQANLQFQIDRDSAILIFGASVVIAVGVALYEALWHRARMRPFLSHLALRHRLHPKDIRTPLSLRAKMLISFGGLVLFACGLSLFWSFIQYKDLAAGFVQKQALQKLDFVRDEVRMRAAKRTRGADVELVREVLQQAALGVLADGGSFYYLPPGGEGAHVVPIHVGSTPVPRLPWPAVALLYRPGEGWLDVAPLRLTGRYTHLIMDEGQDLGTIAVLYPGARFRGPGIERPLKELLIFFIVLFGVSAGIVWFTVSEFTTPIKALEQRAEEMARGELAPPVTAATEADEVGRLTFALEEMRRALRDKLRSTEEVNLDLEREVQRRTADLARKNKELYDALEALKRAQAQLVRSEKMASIGQLVAGIAHEINNPVNAIANTVGPMEDELEGILGQINMRKSMVGTGEQVHEIRDMIRVIQSGARRTKEIVQALHNYSRVDDERWLDVDLTRNLDESLELLRHLMKGSITVARQYGDNTRVKGHAGQLSQVFLNLLTNAAQALGPKGGEIRIKTERTPDRHVRIEIGDNGPGIPPEILPRIFDPFFTTKDVGQGSGLGLSIVHGIVERHGGTIEVNSTVGTGTTFTITLPIEQPPPAAVAPDPPKVVVV